MQFICNPIQNLTIHRATLKSQNNMSSYRVEYIATTPPPINIGIKMTCAFALVHELVFQSKTSRNYSRDDQNWKGKTKTNHLMCLRSETCTRLYLHTLREITTLSIKSDKLCVYNPIQPLSMSDKTLSTTEKTNHNVTSTISSGHSHYFLSYLTRTCIYLRDKTCNRFHSRCIAADQNEKPKL